MKIILAYLLFLALFFIALISYSQPMTRKQFYDSLNHIRQEHGLPALRSSMLLESKAANWLEFLDRYDLGMVHDNDTMDGEVLTNAYDYLAWWMYSPSHRRVLLSRRFTKIGLASRGGELCARLR